MDSIIKALSIILLILAIIACLTYISTNYTGEKVYRLSGQDLANIEKIEESLDVTHKEAQEIKEAIEDKKTSAPSYSYTVNASTPEEAADKVEQSIESGKAPQEVLEESDKTVVSTTDQKVDVYKINLRNNHKIKSGITYIDDHAYLSVGYQAGKFEGYAHFDEHGMSGASVMYTIKEW